MKEIITYIADDGTEFEDEDECLSYEAAQGIKSFFANGQVKMRDKNFHLCESLDGAYFCKVATQEAANALAGYSQYEGYVCPCGGDHFSGKDYPEVGCFYYDTHYDDWRKAEDILNFAKKMKTLFNN